MKQRMSRKERIKQLRRIMKARRAAAHTQEEFAVEDIAAEAEISVVWFYELVGEEYMELRGQLPGRRSPPSNTISKLRRENRELRAKVRALEQKREEERQEELAEAYNLIEEQDEMIRILQGRVRILERGAEAGRLVAVKIPQGRAGRVGPRRQRSKKSGKKKKR